MALQQIKAIQCNLQSVLKTKGGVAELIVNSAI